MKVKPPSRCTNCGAPVTKEGLFVPCRYCREMHNTAPTEPGDWETEPGDWEQITIRNGAGAICAVRARRFIEKGGLACPGR